MRIPGPKRARREFGPASLIVGARTRIQHVGISNFRLPIRYHTRDSGDLLLETSVTGTVSLG